MSQIEAIKAEILSMQEHYERELRRLNDRIDSLVVEVEELKDGKR